MSLLPYLHRVVSRESLSSTEAREAMLAILGGEASTAQIASFLVALRMKGETSQELLGFALAMREKSSRVEAGLDGEPLLDTCGTGGDGPRTFNISTIAACVVAGTGVRVAKHGNRSMSTPCGSADLLEALGLRCAVSADQAARAIREVGIAFLFAPAFHPAMKYAQPARQELKMRTVFNLLGPLTNPARAGRQLIGAPSESAAELMAQALAGLGPERVFVVHGSDGLDEVTTCGTTVVFDVQPGRVSRQEWTPADFGLETASLEQLRGGDRDVNAAIAREILAREPGPRRDIVLANAAAALVVHGKATSLPHGMQLAAESIDSGAAREKLDRLAAFTTESQSQSSSTNL